VLSSHSAAPVGTVLPESVPAKRNRFVPLLLVLALLVLGGGAYAAYAKVLKPSGASPEEATPADAVAFGKVDLDPAAGQKLAVYRLAKRFPKTEVKSDKSVTDDLLKSVFSSAGDAVDYERDIKPWIGKRAAIAGIPGKPGEDPHPLIVVQYDDKDAARSSLTRLTKKANAETPDDPIYFAFSDVDGYVVLSDTQAATDGAAKAKDHLSDEKAYDGAVDKLDGDQIVTLWADVARVYAVIPKSELFVDNPFFKVKDLKPTGQVVVGAHAEDDAIEVTGRTVGLATGVRAIDGVGGASGKGSDMVQTFPEQSIAAFSETGLGKVLSDLYTANETTLRDLDTFGAFDMLKEAGVSLPSDFTAVLGDEVGGYLYGSEDDPHAALRIKTKDAARAKEVISSLASTASGESVPLDDFYAQAPGGYVVGFPKGFLSSAIGGRLGTSKTFRDAVPDAKGAPFVLFVDVQRALELAGDDVPDEVRQLKAVGMTSRSDGKDTSFRLRLTFV
jgi:hypothetical protein